MASSGAALQVAWIEGNGTGARDSTAWWIAWRRNDAHGAPTTWRPVRIIASGQGGTDGVSIAFVGSWTMITWGAPDGLRFAETRDGGGTWTTGPIGPGRKPAVAVGRLGAVVAYLGDGDVPLVRVRPGTAWQEPTTLASLPANGIDAAMSGDRAGVTWATSEGVYVRVLRRAGWGSSVRIARPPAPPDPPLTQPPPLAPVIALQGTSRIGVGWTQARPYTDIDDEVYTINDAWWRETADGAHWSAPQLAYQKAGAEWVHGVVVDARWAGASDRELLIWQSQYWEEPGRPSSSGPAAGHPDGGAARRVARPPVGSAQDDVVDQARRAEPRGERQERRARSPARARRAWRRRPARHTPGAPAAPSRRPRGRQPG